MMKKYGIIAFVLAGISLSLVACGDKPEETPAATLEQAELPDEAVEQSQVPSPSATEEEGAADTMQPAAMEAVEIASNDDKLTAEALKKLGETYYLSFEDESSMTTVNGEDYPIYTTYGSRYPSEEKEYIDASLVIFEEEAAAQAAYDASVENLSSEPEDLTMLAKELEDGSRVLDVLIEDEAYTVLIQRKNAVFMIESVPENAQEVKDLLKDMDIDLSKTK